MKTLRCCGLCLVWACWRWSSVPDDDGGHFSDCCGEKMNKHEEYRLKYRVNMCEVNVRVCGASEMSRPPFPREVRESKCKVYNNEWGRKRTIGLLEIIHSGNEDQRSHQLGMNSCFIDCDYVFLWFRLQPNTLNQWEMWVYTLHRAATTSR